MKHNKLRVQIVMPQTKSGFQVVVEPSTRIQSIIIEVAKKLGVNHLQSNIKLYKKLDRAPMEASSTINQNLVKDRDQLFVQISSTNSGWSYYTKTHDFETAHEYHKYMPKKYITPGLVIECMCVNPKCINYGKLKVIPLGTGHHNLNQILTGTKCHLCPDRDKQTNPPMALRSVKLVSCYWRFEGDIVKSDGFPSRDFSRGWRKVEDFDAEAFGKVWLKEKWTDLDIVCRGL